MQGSAKLSSQLAPSPTHPHWEEQEMLVHLHQCKSGQCLESLRTLTESLKPTHISLEDEALTLLQLCCVTQALKHTSSDNGPRPVPQSV